MGINGADDWQNTDNHVQNSHAVSPVTEKVNTL
jgi:hypothetical protein